MNNMITIFVVETLFEILIENKKGNTTSGLKKHNKDKEKKSNGGRLQNHRQEKTNFFGPSTDSMTKSTDIRNKMPK